MGQQWQRWLLFIVLLLGLYPAMPANADEIRPALMDIKVQNTGLFAVTWKVPTRGDRAAAVHCRGDKPDRPVEAVAINRT